AVFAHYFSRFDRHIKITANIDVERFLKCAQIGVENMAVIRIGGSIVDENIEAPVRMADMRENRGDILHAADIAGEGFGATARLPDGSAYVLTILQLAAGDNHIRSLLCEQPGNLLTDTAAGAGDERDFSAQIEQ